MTKDRRDGVVGTTELPYSGVRVMHLLLHKQSLAEYTHWLANSPQTKRQPSLTLAELTLISDS